MINIRGGGEHTARKNSSCAFSIRIENPIQLTNNNVLQLVCEQ